MKNILLICTAGMSTSALVLKMEQVAKDEGINAKIWAVGDAEKLENIPKADVILLGPQVRFMKSSIQKIAQGKPVMVIDMVAYGAMNGKKVLDDAIKAIN